VAWSFTAPGKLESTTKKSVIGQDPDLTIEEASDMAANARRAALMMFPDKELAYDLIYRPRLQRLINERFRLQ
jgi:hypothetical protein